MFDNTRHKKQLAEFLSRIEEIQQEMLNLRVKETIDQFGQLYTTISEYLDKAAQQLHLVKKGENNFLGKKQISLMLKNIEILQQENAELSNYNGAEIINYFEKQLVLKKIIKRQIGE